MERSNEYGGRTRRRSATNLDPDDRDRLDRLFDGFVLFFVAMSPLALGGSHPKAQFWLAGAASGLSILGMIFAWVRRRAWTWRPLPLVLIALAGWTLFRSTPASGFLAGRVARDVFGLWPEIPVRSSVAPGMAALSAWKTLGVGLLLQLCSIRFSRSTDRGRVATAVVIGAGLVAAIGLAQFVSGAEQVLWVYEPRHGWSYPLAGPFVNANQAGSLLGLAAILLLLAAWTARDGAARGLLALGAIGAAILILALDAMGALLSMGAALAVFGVIVASEGQWERARRRRILAAVVAGALGATAGFAWGASSVLELSAFPGAHQKALLWLDAARLVRHAPVLGLGAGGFQDIFPLTQTIATRFSYWSPESGPLHLLVEHGVVGLIGLGIPLALISRGWIRAGTQRKPETIPAIAIVATYLGAEAITGAGWFALGYAIPAAAMLGAGLDSSRAGRPTPTVTPSGWMALAPVVVATALGVWSLAGASGSVAASMGDRAQLAATLLQSEVPDPAQIEVALLAAGRATPGDPQVLLASVAFELESDVDRAEQFVGHLRRYAPRWPNTWRAEMQVAARNGEHDRACAGLRALLSLPPAEFSWSISDFRSYSVDPRAWLDCLPREPDAGERMYSVIFAEGLPQEAMLAALHELAREPTNASALRAAIHASVAMGHPEVAVPWVRSMLTSVPGDAESFRTAAGVLQATGARREALDALERGLSEHPGSLELRFDHARVLLALAESDAAPSGWEAQLEDDLAACRSRALTDPGWSVRFFELQGEFHSRTGRWALAVVDFERLVRLDGENPRWHERLGWVAERRGQIEPALEHYRRALSLDPSHAASLAGVERAEANMGVPSQESPDGLPPAPSRSPDGSGEPLPHVGTPP